MKSIVPWFQKRSNVSRRLIGLRSVIHTVMESSLLSFYTSMKVLNEYLFAVRPGSCREVASTGAFRQNGFSIEDMDIISNTDNWS